MFRVAPSRSGYSGGQSRALIRNLLVSLRNLPEVQNAALGVAELLSGGSWNQRLTIESGRRVVTDDVAHCNAVSPGFF